MIELLTEIRDSLREATKDIPEGYNTYGSLESVAVRIERALTNYIDRSIEPNE